MLCLGLIFSVEIQLVIRHYGSPRCGRPRSREDARREPTDCTQPRSRETKEVAHMRRMMSLVTVVVVMTAMMAAGVAPAMADNLKGEPGQPIISGGTDGRGQGTEVLHW